MSNTSSATNTMSKSASAPAKKVSKKSDAPVAEVAAVAVSAAAVAAPVAEKSKKAAAAKPAAAVAAAPVASTVAPATDAPVAEAKTVEQEVGSLIAVFQQQRDQAVAAIKTLQRLQKRVAKDVKEAGRRRRRGKKETEDGVPKEKRPTIFTTPVTLKDQLCAFLGKAKGSQMTPADVTRAFSAYVDSKKLKDAEKGHTIHPDEPMRKVLGVKDGETLTYRNIQSYLYKLYVLPEKKKAATA